MFTGRIEGIGPRYCPSIEDKINRFAERESHQLFIEPEGWNTVEIYVNGFTLPYRKKFNTKLFVKFPVLQISRSSVRVMPLNMIIFHQPS